MNPSKADDRPRVFCCMPASGACRIEAAAGHYALPTRGQVEVIPGHALSSVLTHAHNLLWAAALSYAKAGIIDYWLCHHADVEIRTHGWLDLMVEEMRRVGAAVLSVVQPIKDDSGDTSTAIETKNPWSPRRLTLQQCAAGPETFTHPGLLVNTGLMLVDVKRQEFHEEKEGVLRFCFTIQDQITVSKDGYKATYKPEDWNFSRLCHAAGLEVYATRKITCIHWGQYGFSNESSEPNIEYQAEPQGWFDFQEVYRRAVARTPDLGTLVEVGCWKGKSLKFLLEEVKRSGKRLQVIGVDHFRGSVGEEDLKQEAAATDIEKECRRACDAVDCPYILWKMDSAEGAAQFSSQVLSFVFIDASHDYNSVKEDVLAWLPKIKPGGVIAGHDIDYPDVARAVKECLPDFQTIGRSWWYEVPAGVDMDKEWERVKEVISRGPRRTDGKIV